MGEQGKVLVRVLVSAEGLVERVELKNSSGSRRLDQAALDAVRQLEVRPGAARGSQGLGVGAGPDRFYAPRLTHGTERNNRLRPLPRPNRHGRQGDLPDPDRHVAGELVSDHRKGAAGAHRAPPHRALSRDVLERTLARIGGTAFGRTATRRPVLAPCLPLDRVVAPSRAARCEQAERGRQRIGVPHPFDAPRRRRGDVASGVGADRARVRGQHRAFRRPVRDGVGRVSRPGQHRPERAGDARQGRRARGRSPDHDRGGPRSGGAGCPRLQRVRALQPRGAREARRFRARPLRIPHHRLALR